MIEIKESLKIEEAISNIEKEIDQGLTENSSISLFTGTGGFSLFYHLLYEQTGDEKYKAKFDNAIDNLYDRLNDENYSYTYCDGLIGVAYLLNFYQKNDLLESEEVEDALLFFDDLILTRALRSLEARKQGVTELDDGNYYLDFLHGTLGAMYYLNSRSEFNHELRLSLNELFEGIGHFILEDMEKKATMETPFNCGLAHGVVSYMMVYSKFLELNPKHELATKLLRKCSGRLLAYRTKDSNSIAQFPSIVHNESKINYKVPLGWCYGDQTATLVLHKVGKLLNDETVMSEALEIAIKTTARNTVVKASRSEMTDAGFCHGMSSIAYLHKRWFQISGDERFLEQYQYFLNEVLKRGTHENCLSGFKKYMGREDGFKNAEGLLDGSSGIGVFLIDSLYESTLNWDELFLIR